MSKGQTEGRQPAAFSVSPLECRPLGPFLRKKVNQSYEKFEQTESAGAFECGG